MKSNNVVFVHGMLGWGKDEMFDIPYWGKALKVKQQRFELHEASCGPVSSFHDRACEVAAQIRGSKVDYGKAHSEAANHAQFSNDYTGKALFKKDWSSANPVILIGHSAGAHTCMQLQQLLADDYWGWGSNADWVEVIISISGVINGSTLTYLLGCDEKTGQLDGFIGNSLGKTFETLALLAGNSSIYDFDLDQWISNDHGHDITKMITALNKTEFAKGKDNLAYDLTLQGCYQANSRFKTNPNTYYLSVVTEQTTDGKPEAGINLALRPSAIYQGKKINFDEDPIPGWGSGDLDGNKWKENDGAVSSISQRYPFSAGTHPVGGEGFVDKGTTLEKGKWYFENADSITERRFDHFDVGFGYINNLFFLKSHIELYEKIYKLLSKLE